MPEGFVVFGGEGGSCEHVPVWPEASVEDGTSQTLTARLQEMAIVKSLVDRCVMRLTRSDGETVRWLTISCSPVGRVSLRETWDD